MTDTRQQAAWVRWARWLHRKIALALFIFFFIVSVTGVLLGLKKQTGLLAPTQKGASSGIKEWLPVSELERRAIKYLHDSIDKNLSTKLDRIDIRPEKGIAKFVYTDHYWGLQLDCTTGGLLSIERRNSDLIENIHDGSILDRLLATGEGAKIGYTFIMGISLLSLVLSGLWLWYGPKRIRQLKRKHI